MTLEEIQKEWSQDSEFDRSELGQESLKISRLHSKYFNMFSRERLKLRKQEIELKQLRKKLYDFLVEGPSTSEEMHEAQNNYGWTIPARGKVLKADAQMIIDADPHICDMTLRAAYQFEKVDFLENIIKTLSRRSFEIKAAIDWEKFKVGL